MRFLLGIILLLAMLPTTALADVAVIVNPTVETRSISKDRLLDMFTGDIKHWENGEPVVLLDLETRGPVKDAFYGFLGKTSSKMKAIWLRMVLSGEGQPPRAVADEDVVKIVAETPGAIGYVNRSRVDTSVVTVLVIPTD